MKPHAHLPALSSNPLLALRAAVGPQGLTPDAGKDALLTDAGDNGFASIMAQQLAQLAAEELMPVADQLASVSAQVQVQPQEDTDEQLAAQSLQVEPGWPATYVPTPVTAAVSAAVSAAGSAEPLPAQSTVAATVQMDPKALPMPLRAADRSPRTDTPAAPTLLTEAKQAPVAIPAPVQMVASSTMPVTTPSAMAVQPPMTEADPRMLPLASDKPPVTLPSAAVAMPADHPTNRVVQAVQAEGPPSLRMVTATTATTEKTTATTTASATDRPPSVVAEVSINEPTAPPAKIAMVDDQTAPPAWVPPQGMTSVRLSDATQVAGVAPNVSQPTDDVVAMPRVEQPVESTQVRATASAAVGSSAEVAVPSKVSTPVATPVATQALPQSALATAKAPEAAAPLTLGHLLASQQAVPRTATSTVDAFSSRSSPRTAALSAAPSREPDAPWGSKVSDLWLSPGAETLQPAAQALSPSATRATAAERAPVEAPPTYQEQNVPLSGAMGMPPAALPTAAYRMERHEVASLPQAVGTSAFTDELVGRVNVWVKQSAQDGPMTAELHLNPAEMGPVLIRIEVNGQQAQVNFSAQQADTRQAIESSLSMLSASLEEAGIQLSGSGVSDQGHSPQQAWGFEGRGDGQPRQSSQSFAMATQQLPADAPGSDEPPDADAWRTPAANRSGGSASGLDLYA